MVRPPPVTDEKKNRQHAPPYLPLPHRIFETNPWPTRRNTHTDPPPYLSHCQAGPEGLEANGAATRPGLPNATTRPRSGLSSEDRARGPSGRRPLSFALSPFSPACLWQRHRGTKRRGCPARHPGFRTRCAREYWDTHVTSGGLVWCENFLHFAIFLFVHSKYCLIIN